MYIGIPNNPDESSTDKIRFKCKSPCIDNCFENNRNKRIVFYDSKDESVPWYKDDTIKATCQDGNNNTRRTSVQNIDSAKPNLTFPNNQIQKGFYPLTDMIHLYILPLIPFLMREEILAFF